MRKLQMVDLKSQYEKIKEEVNASIQEVLDTNTYINGPLVHQFQADLEKYLGVKHVIPCANGTDALQIAMMGLDLKPGDEVITADFTFAATVEVIALLQLTPVLVDVDMNNMNISLDGIRKAITPKTKAIIFDCFGTLMEIREKQMPYKYLREELYKSNIVIDDFARIVMQSNCDIKEFEKLANYKFTNEQKIKFKQMLEKELRSIHIFEDVNQYLKELDRRNIKTALCSNLAEPYGKSAKTLTFPLNNYILSYDVGYIKPDKEIFQKCLDSLNVKKEEAIYVGDSIKDDYKGATEFGINAYLIKRK